MPKRISYTDGQLREAITTSRTWPEVMRKIGRHPSTTSERVRPDAVRLGIDCSHVGGRSSPDLSAERRIALPFGNRTPKDRMLETRALAEAMTWFIERGYPVSLPVEPVAYDLVAESDAGLQRVQVKSCRQQGASGRFEVKFHRSKYIPAENGLPGRYRRTPYRLDEVDLFFVLCGDGSKYLVPTAAVLGQLVAVITAKYAIYRV